MKFSITGVNHKSAPVEVRERLAFDESALSQALVALKGRPGFCEGMILSTCNRVEVALTCEENGSAAVAVDQFLADTRQVQREWVTPYLYRFEDSEAIRHLFRVASSLDSMVIGEPQILGQLKSAYSLAKEHGAVSGFMDMLLTRAFNVAKRVRSETDIGENAVSISYAAVELAREIFGSLAGKKVMIVGAGKMSELAARHLRRSGAGQILVTNRTHERALEMAELFDGKLVDYTRFLSALPEVDIVIASSGAPHYIIVRDDMKKVLEARRNKPMFLIDIAVPRNIEPTRQRTGQRLPLRHRRSAEGDRHQSAGPQGIGRRRRGHHSRGSGAHGGAPEGSRGGAHHRQAARGAGTAARGAKSRAGDPSSATLTPEQEQAIEAFTKSMMNKIAHGPISEIRRQASQPDGHHIISAVRKVFRLD